MCNWKILGLLGLLLVAVGMLPLGCGDSSSGGGFANVKVQYTISGNQITHNANTSRDYYIPISGTDYKELTWFCGDYQDHSRSRVEITFKKSDNTWLLERVDYGSGSCS